MKKLSILFFGLILLASCTNITTEREEATLDLTVFADIKLLAPDIENPATLMQALQNRRSHREFSEKELTLEDLSNVLWAAYGVNRENGMRTVPSAVALYPIRIFAVLSNGIFYYNAQTHVLEAIVEGDFRTLQGQEFAHIAPLNIMYIADMSVYDHSPFPVSEEVAIKFAMADASHSSQNVYLYAAAFGLRTVIRGGGFDEPALLYLLNLDERHRILLAQTVGY